MKLKEYLSYTWVKENIGMLLFAPTALGGLWQLFELNSIGTPYIRFFSISQLVSDGLLILFIFAWAFVIVVFNTYSKKMMDFVIRESPEQKEKQEVIAQNRSKTFKLVVLFIGLVNCGFMTKTMLLDVIKVINQTGRITIGEVIIFTSYMVFTLTLFRLIFLVLSGMYGWTPFFERQSIANLVRFLGVICIGALLFGLLWVFSLFHRSFLLPDNFKNKSYVECRVKKDNPRLKSWNIRYFNDKYIFVEIVVVDGKKQIEVYPFELFMEEDCRDYSSN